MTKKDNAPVPMDAGAAEGDAPAMYKPNDRNCYAMEQLISEVEQLFPGVIYEVSSRNPRGVAFDVTFVPADGTDPDFRLLLELLGDPAYNTDPRIEYVIPGSDGVLVSFRTNPHTMDDRSPFGLAEAWSVLSGEES